MPRLASLKDRSRQAITCVHLAFSPEATDRVEVYKQNLYQGYKGISWEFFCSRLAI
jgi:hypothetical protein